MSKSSPPKSRFPHLTQLLLSLMLFLSIVSNTVLFLSWQPVTNLIYTQVVDKVNPLGTITQRTQLLTQTLQYLRSPSVQEWKLVLNDEELTLTASERQHMADVKQLLLTVKIVSRVSTLLLVLMSLLVYRYDTTVFNRALSHTSTLLIILPFGSLVGIILFWNFSFTLFHQLLFEEGTWSFPADSITIQLFPEQFWVAMFVSYLVIIMGIGGTVRVILAKACLPAGRRGSRRKLNQ